MRASKEAVIQRVSPSIGKEELAAIIDRDGAVILSGLYTPEEWETLQGELDPVFAATAFCKGLFYGTRTKRIHALAAKSRMCQRMVMQELVLEIMGHVLGPHCDRIQLNLTQGIQIWPGEKAQVLHRDDSMYGPHAKPCEYMVNAMWAYSAFTRENGATIIVPGSHRWPADRQPEPHEITQAEMVPGEVLVYLGSAIHAGGANRSSGPRTGMVLSYCLGWLRQAENQYLAVPPQIARHLDGALQDMLGYAVQRPNLGLYEGAEPKILFDTAHGPIVTQDWLTPEQNELLRRYHEGEALLAA